MAGLDADQKDEPMALAEDFARLEKRVTALEKASINNTETITWMAGTLGTMKAVQEMHTTRLDGIDKVLDDHTRRLDRIDGRLDRIEAEVKGLRNDMPSIVAEAMREVMGKGKA